MADKIYKDFHEESFLAGKTAIIDSDGLAWAIGWIERETLDINGNLSVSGLQRATDNCVHDILRGVRAEHYIGVLSPKQRKIVVGISDGNPLYGDAVPNFRRLIAKSRPYKGNRPDRPEWYLNASPIIENHLEQAWGFIRTPEGFEADDMVATLMHMHEGLGEAICCGNDKDLLQIRGKHFDVKKKSFQTIDAIQASKNLWMQCLTGDSTDNIEGIPGCGPKGAQKILATADQNSMLQRTSVMEAYIDKFGEDIGIQKFYENYMLVKLRTDVPVDGDQDMIRGYDLAYWDAQYATPSEPDEEVPDFSA